MTAQICMHAHTYMYVHTHTVAYLTFLGRFPLLPSRSKVTITVIINVPNSTKGTAAADAPAIQYNHTCSYGSESLQYAVMYRSSFSSPALMIPTVPV